MVFAVQCAARPVRARRVFWRPLDQRGRILLGRVVKRLTSGGGLTFYFRSRTLPKRREHFVATFGLRVGRIFNFQPAVRLVFPSLPKVCNRREPRLVDHISVSSLLLFPFARTLANSLNRAEGPYLCFKLRHFSPRQHDVKASGLVQEIILGVFVPPSRRYRCFDFSVSLAGINSSS